MLGVRFVLGFLVVCSLWLLGVSVFGVGGGLVASEGMVAVDRAESRVAECYGVVLEVEGVGGDVSGLVARLEAAGWWLSRARVALRAGNVSGAVVLADRCREVLVGFEVDAMFLWEEAVERNRVDLLVNVVGSVVATVIVVLGGGVVWCWLSKRDM